MGERQDLINVFQPVGVTAEREVDERNAERRDILDRQIGSRLSISLHEAQVQADSP